MAAILELLRVLIVALLGFVVRAAAGEGGVVHTPGQLPDLTYSLAYEAGELPALSVGLSFDGDPDGSTTVSLPDQWGGVDDHAADVQAIVAVVDGSGEAVAVVPDGPRAWKIQHKPGERIRCTYRLVPAEHRERLQGNDYRTVVAPDHVQLIGNIALLCPDHLRTSDPRDIELDLAGLDRPEWRVASSFGPGTKRQTLRMPPERFLHSTIIAGNGRLLERTIGHNRVGVYIQSNDFNFDDDEFADLCSTIISTERDFFADHSDPWFLVSIVPQGSAREGGFSIGGTGLTNAFSLYCSPGLSLEPDSGHLAQFQRLLAHEYMHTWIGGKISPAESRAPDTEPLVYWFTEGFTDFFARRVLHASGLWTDAQYASDLSDSLGQYDASPEKSAPNARIAQAFWTDANVRSLPYRRGDLVALALDERLRRDSGGSRSLDTFLRDVLTRAVQNGDQVSSDSLLALMESYTDPAFVAELRTFIDSGGEPPLPDHTSAPALTLSSRTMRSTDPGFNIEATRAAKILTGVVPGSGAAEAGLTDGMSLVSFRMDGGSGAPPQAVAIIKDSSGSDQTITYEALSPLRTVRAYVVQPPAGP